MVALVSPFTGCGQVIVSTTVPLRFPDRLAGPMLDPT